MDFKKTLANLDLIIAAIAFVCLVFVTFGGVIMRYVFSDPFIWAEEVQLWSFLWMIFLGAGAAFRYGSHVAVEIIFDKLPQQFKSKVNIVNYLITVAILGYLFFLGLDLLSLMVKIGKATSILHVPFWFINAVIPVSCVIMIISATYAYFFKKETETKEDTE